MSFDEWKRKWLLVEAAHNRALKRKAKRLKAEAKAEKRAA